MTSLAAILGLFPLALGIGPGAQMQQPLAIMVIGGLTANMLFTRLVIPAGYLILERRKERAADPDRARRRPSPPATRTGGSAANPPRPAASAGVPPEPPARRRGRESRHTWRIA